MSLTYAIGDVHGRLDLLQLLLLEIEHDSPEGGTVVFLGDYVDRGPDSKGVLDLLMAGPSDPRWRWITLMGNHEDMMNVALEEPMKMTNAGGMWLVNGGHATLVSFGDADVEPYRAWMQRLPVLHYDGYRVFVHAGVDPTRPLDDQSENYVLWARDQMDHPNAYVVHGHTPNPRGPVIGTGRVNMDTLAYKTGRLCAAVFEDEVDSPPLKILEAVLP